MTRGGCCPRTLVFLRDTENGGVCAGRRLRPGKAASPGETRMRGRGFDSVFRDRGAGAALYGHLYDLGGRDASLLFDAELSRESLTDVPEQASPWKAEFFRAEGRCVYRDREYLFSPASAWGARLRGLGRFALGAGVKDGRRVAFAAGESENRLCGLLSLDGRAFSLAGPRVLPEPGGRAAPFPLRLPDGEGRLALQFVPGGAACGGLLVGSFRGSVAIPAEPPLLLDGLPGFAQAPRGFSALLGGRGAP